MGDYSVYPDDSAWVPMVTAPYVEIRHWRDSRSEDRCRSCKEILAHNMNYCYKDKCIKKIYFMGWVRPGTWADMMIRERMNHG